MAKNVFVVLGVFAAILFIIAISAYNPISVDKAIPIANASQMQDGMIMEILVLIFGPILTLMIGIIGYFGKRALDENKQDMDRLEKKIGYLINKMEQFVTKDYCLDARESCHDKELIKETLEGKLSCVLSRRLDDQIEAFENLSKCLTKFTKGECP